MVKTLLFGAAAVAALVLAPSSNAQEEKRTGPAGPGVMFERLDRNQDGFITVDEVPPPMLERFGELLKKADRNGDKKLDKAEFAEFAKQMLDARRPQRAAEPADESPQAPAAGRERGQQAKPEGREAWAARPVRGPQGAKAMFDRLDVDKDGKLSYEEFAQGLAALHKARQAQMARHAAAMRQAHSWAGRPGMQHPGLSRGPLGQRGMGGPGMGQHGMGFGPMGRHGMGGAGAGQPPMGPSGMTPPGMGRGPQGQGGMGGPPMGQPGMGFGPMGRHGMGGAGAGQPPMGPSGMTPPGMGHGPQGQGGMGGPPMGQPGMGFGFRGGRGMGGPGMGAPAGVERGMIMFQRMDTDRDGKISKSEAPEWLKQNFDKIDTNHDGAISPEELQEASAARMKARQSAGAKTAEGQEKK
ncbi:MAG: EF-hand domain-containing protein [Planctomycetota bacterium]|nr:EF-hand domain-containing protein [Planctomycetota bacterium]